MTETGFTSVNGTEFYYEIAGEGQPLALIHAGICDSRMWDDQFEVFARRYRVIRYDLRGYGKTRPVGGEFSHYEDLRGILRHLGIERAILLGCSMGGETCINAALAYPQMVSGLALVAPVCRVTNTAIMSRPSGMRLSLPSKRVISSAFPSLRCKSGSTGVAGHPIRSMRKSAIKSAR